MQDIAIFPDNGIWCKGNLHAHTQNSDGKLSPDEVVAKYKGLGHDFISLTDHRKYICNAHLNSKDFVVIPGFEVDLTPPGKNMCHHIVAVRGKISDKNYDDGYAFASPE